MIEEQKEFNSVKLSLVLLNSICKLFFVRAPEVHKILAAFMEQLIKNATDADLRQRAVFYYRLLKHDIEAARKVIVGEGEAIELFFEDQNDDMKERLFLEFNTLSVVYQKPAEKFLKDIALKKAVASEKKYYQGRFNSTGKEGSTEEGKGESTADADKKTDSKPIEEDLLGFGSSDPAPPASEPVQESTAQPSLLPDDLLSGFGSQPA